MYYNIFSKSDSRMYFIHEESPGTIGQDAG